MLTQRDAILLTIARHLAERDRSPSPREIARAVAGSLSSSVYNVLGFLRRGGLITYATPDKIQLTSAGRRRLAELTAPKIIIPDLLPVIRCTCGTARVGEGACFGCGARVVVTLRGIARAAA